MGILGAKRLVADMARDKGAHDALLTYALANADILAVDANSIVYWAYETFIATHSSTDETHKYSTSKSAATIMNSIVELVMTFMKNMVTILRPQILVIVMDGVPPMAKIIQQKIRRMDESPNDLYDTDGNVVFSMSWFVPNSRLASLLDEAFTTMREGGTKCTIYSGPGVPGEGEHKIFPILQALCRYGDDALNSLGDTDHDNNSGGDADNGGGSGSADNGGGSGGVDNSANTSKTPRAKVTKSPEMTVHENGHDDATDVIDPKTIYIFGNDNDFYILGMMFLVTFETNNIKLYMYNDGETRKKLPLQNGKSPTGIYSIMEPSDIKLSDIRVFLNAVLDSSYSCVQTTTTQENHIEKVIHFTYLASLLGNDFVPQLPLAAEDQRIDISRLMRTIASAGREGASFIGYFKVPIILNDDNMEFASIVSDKKILHSTMRSISETVNADILRISPTYTNAVPQDALIKIAKINGRGNDGNGVALAAAYTYIKMLDAVISYYVSSTFMVPRTVYAQFVSTMPNWYYSYGVAPPNFTYLQIACQIIAEMAAGNLAKYGKLSKALANNVMACIDIDASACNPAIFMNPLVHSALIFPSRSLNVVSEAIIEDSKFLARSCAGLFPMKSHPNVNTCLLPGTLVNMAIACFNSQHAAQVAETSTNGNFQRKVVVARGNKRQQFRKHGNYVEDSLNV